MMKRLIQVFGVVLPVFTLAMAHAQQGAGGEPPAMRSSVDRAVQVPVTVRDKKGTLITSLAKGDVVLTEDGRPQVIQSFSRASDLPFQIGLIVDTSRGMSGALEMERKALNHVVDRVLDAPQAGEAGTSGDEVFLMHFDREVELIVDFTRAAEKLHREIDDLSATARSSQDRDGPETTGDDRERTRASRGSTQLYDAIFLASDELMKPKTGRKVLIVFSDGVDNGSKESMSEALDAADHAGLSIYTIYLKGESDRGDNPFEDRRRGGTGGGYPGGGGRYPGGGGGYPGGGHGSGEKARVDGKKILAQLADRTGGQAFEAKKRENLVEIYDLIAEELRAQYLLTYTPDVVDKDGGYHKIVLKPNKSDLTVTTREGYYAPGGDAR